MKRSARINYKLFFNEESVACCKLHINYMVLLSVVLFLFAAWMEVNYSVISKTEGIMHLQKQVKRL